MRNASKTRSRLRVGLLAAGALGLGLAACDGSNTFSPVGVGPSVVDLFAPQQAPSSSEFQVAARAVAAVRVDSIVVTVNGGGVDYRETRVNAGRENDVTYTFDVSVPAAISDTIATISAIAFDAQGNQSLTRTRTIRLVDASPPEVQVAASAGEAAQGDVVTFAVSASDNIGVARTGVEVRDPAGQVVFSDSVPGASTQPPGFEWQVAVDAALGTYTARAFAVDASGNRGSSEGVSIVVTPRPDRTAPTVVISDPAEGSQYFVGDEIPVLFTVADDQGPVRSGVTSITVQVQAIVGSAVTGQTTVTTLAPAANFTLQDVGAAGPIIDPISFGHVVRNWTQDTPAADRFFFIIVSARDAAGNVGADTLRVESLGPRPDEDDGGMVLARAGASRFGGSTGAAMRPEEWRRTGRGL